MTDELRPEVNVVSFTSMDEMLAEQERKEREFEEQIFPKQREITYGTYFFRVSGNVPIFTYVYTLEELRKLEEDAGAEEDELEYFMERIQSVHARGYRTGIHYSQIEPEGEQGDAHIVSCWPISELDFQRAKSNGWMTTPDMAVRIHEELEEAIRAKQGR